MWNYSQSWEFLGQHLFYAAWKQWSFVLKKLNLSIYWTYFRILEIISTFSTNETVEGLLDLYNIFIGVFIFFIFVFKRKVLYELKCRFGKIITAWGDICIHSCIPFKKGLVRKSTELATPRSTTITHTGNISMKDMTFTSDKSLALLTASSTTLQIPKTG